MTQPATHVWRLLKWGRTLARHGALRGIEADLNTPPQVRRLVRIARFGTRQPRIPDYAAAFQEIGPAAIKLGQTLATRPDLVGDEAAHNLLSLQDSLPPVPFDHIRADVERSFEAPLGAVFAEIDPVPVGSASIAQVHKAVTNEGRTVAIKVLRPGIRERFAKDIDTYEWAAAHLEALGGEARRLRPRLTIANFKRWTNSELDLRREAASASELAEAMKGFEGYCVPSIDWDRTNGRVMTIEWIDGIKIGDVAALKAAGHDLPQLASRLVLAFLTQAISAGFFHADMHQGNLFVRPDGTIVAIDFGIMGRIDRRARQWLAEILYGLTTGNYRRVAEIHFEAQYVPSYHSVEEFATSSGPNPRWRTASATTPKRSCACRRSSAGSRIASRRAAARPSNPRCPRSSSCGSGRCGQGTVGSAMPVPPSQAAHSCGPPRWPAGSDSKNLTIARQVPRGLVLGGRHS